MLGIPPAKAGYFPCGYWSAMCFNCSQELFDVTAYAPSEEIELESLVQELDKHGLYGVVPFPAGLYSRKLPE